MKTITLNITVSGGTSILGIIYKIFKKGTTVPLFEKTENGSFSEDFKLNENAEYDLYIIGSNPLSIDKNTRVKIDGDIVLSEDSDLNPANRKGNGYLLTYHFKVINKDKL
ncbi:hypothetical protein [Chryseobacterium sp. MEBOG07]|uniref:hypothetical protein n=1 Tax=Chryseobacterium sp. MEBOG07 TaxID=2879939 RepID=UPI001F29190E|nr:hypothetical protein [Chryseobacterium sp. MEBOG07]UKB79192.1 hypothetical protein LF886_22650 [Chryseobacterium sp. MEBOG07]